MKVSFRTQYRDLMAFNFRVFFFSPIGVGFFSIILIIGIRPNWRAVAQTAPDKSLLYQIVLFALLELIPVVIMFSFLVAALMLLNINKKLKTVYTDQTISLGENVTVSLGDDGIISESTNSRSEIHWSAVQLLVQTRSHIFMLVTHRRNLIIPMRAFESDETAEEFRKTCQAKKKILSHRN